MLPFGPVPTISQSIARYFVGIPADVCVQVGLWLLDVEGQWAVVLGFVFTCSFGFSWLLLLFTETVEEGRLCADVKGLELQCEALAVLLG